MKRWPKSKKFLSLKAAYQKQLQASGFRSLKKANACRYDLIRRDVWHSDLSKGEKVLLEKLQELQAAHWKYVSNDADTKQSHWLRSQTIKQCLAILCLG